MAAVAVVGALWACGEGGEVTDPPEEETAILATVTQDGSAAPGVVVRLFAAGSESPAASGTTDGEGLAVFGDLSAGSYEVEVEVPSGAELESGSRRRSVTVAEGATETVTFRLVTQPSSGLVEVRLTSSLEFRPSEVVITPGTTVRWVNDATMFHTITPDGHDEWTEGTVSAAGDTFEHTFETGGAFDYFCAPHLGAGMTGVVRVQ